MTLHAIIQADASTVFCNVNDFAEVVTYYALHGTAREITVQVFRDALGVLAEDGDTVLAAWEIHVTNSKTLGISSEELNIGGDSLEFAPRVGKDKQRKSITRLIGHDEGMMILECR